LRLPLRFNFRPGRQAPCCVRAGRPRPGRVRVSGMPEARRYWLSAASSAPGLMMAAAAAGATAAASDNRNYLPTTCEARVRIVSMDAHVRTPGGVGMRPYRPKRAKVLCTEVASQVCRVGAIMGFRCSILALMGTPVRLSSHTVWLYR
jgi:hypothetical protein